MRGGRSAKRRRTELLVDLTRVGWGRSNPAFRQVFTTLYMPDATWPRLRRSTRCRGCRRAGGRALREASYGPTSSALARRVVVPTLVMHVRDDAIAPFEEGRASRG